MDIADLFESITIRNDNSVKDTIITAIALIPIIPGGIIMVVKYMKKVKLSFNKYYNFNDHAKRIKAIHGIEVFRR